MTEQTFDSSIAFLQKYYGHVLDRTVLRMYWNMLKGINDEEFKEAAKSMVATFRPTAQVPFPLVADFLNTMGKTGELAIQNGMARLDKAIKTVGGWATVDLGDRSLHAVVDQFGGWRKVSSWDYNEWKFNRRAFMDAYRGAKSSGRKGPERLVGSAEQQNANTGHDRPAPVHRIYSDIDGRLRIEQIDKPLLAAPSSCPQCGAELDANKKCVAQCSRYERIGYDENIKPTEKET